MSHNKAPKKIVDGQGQELFVYRDKHALSSRRDFLNAGLISFAATMAAPSILTLLSRRAYAEAGIVCPTGNASGLVPLITVNLSGGAAMTANWVPMDKGLQLLPSYDKMGLGSPSNITIETVMGAPFAGNGVSKFITGLRTTAVTSLLKTSFVGVPVQSRDDSNANKFDISGMAAKAGFAGGVLPNLGTRGTATGINQDFAFVKPPSPLVVSSFADLTAALGVAGSLNQLNASQKTGLFKLIQNLNSQQSRSIASDNGGKEVGILAHCAGESNKQLSTQSSAVVSPVSDTAFANVWGVTAATAPNSQNMVLSSLVYNVLKGNSGTVNIDLGGYDYHNGTRTSGDTKDQEAGTLVGRILESAAVLNSKVFVVVTSDGAVSSAISNAIDSPWVSDRGNAGAIYMMGYDPAKAPETSGYQLGQFTIGQAADESFVTGGTPELAAAAVFANYMSFNGKIPLFEKTVPRVFTTDQLEKVLKFRT